jgi:hypothetical protein
VKYTLSLPKTTLPGGYYAVAFAQTQAPKVANSITLNERVGEIFYLQAAGPVVQKGQLLSWASNIFQEPPLTSTIRLEDSGAVNFPATIHYLVKDAFGGTKYSLGTIKEVLPQTIRRVTIVWNSTPSLGIFKVTGTVSFLNHTHNLPTKWVLIMSRTVRIYALLILGVLVLLIIVRVFYHLIFRHGKRRSRNKKK